MRKEAPTSRAAHARRTLLCPASAPAIVALAITLALTLAGCGGGDDAATSPPITTTPTTPTTPTGPTWTAGVYAAASTYAAKCAAPRAGTDPQTGRAYVDTAGSALTEKFWLRSWTNDLYLWYAEVLDSDPALTASTLAYFDLQKTTATTSSGRAKDRFHFTYTTEEWRQLSQSGNVSGYGADWQLLSGTPPRRLVISFVEPVSPAATAGLGRGMEVQTIDGVDLINDNTSTGVATLNRGIAPSANGETHQFVVRERGGATRAVSLTSATVTVKPVPAVRVLAGGVGYLLFNTHIATAEAQLVDGITTLRNANVTDLVLDLRYNGGGYLDIASELGWMIGGTRVAGKTFERVQFNSRYPSTNPVIGGALDPVPFRNTTQGFSLTSGQALPTLNLTRVVVLTTAETCSASESIINGLIGAGVQVVQVGANTCGKPYGFYPTDNCGTTYFSIQFRGINAAGFGDYADGFSANRGTGDARANLAGCAVADDYSHDLGDATEGQLAAGLRWLSNGACTSTITGTSAPTGPRAASASLEGADGPPALRLPDEEWRNNRILRQP